MNDPYKVLNVSPNATDAEIKQAYRELARKYHPDNYAQNPLSDLAEEKMKEINEAYDLIMKQRSGGGSGYSNNGGYQQYGSQNQGSYGGSGVYARIRQYISMGSLLQAEQMLNSVPDRNAEWYFLMGALCYRKGWFDEALRNYRTACEMDPANQEYRQALNMMQAGGRAYRAPQGYGGEMSSMDCCTNLICADCCCECMGGNLIPCIGCR